MFVRLIGLEPTRRKTPDPKSGASTNFATGALFRFGHPPILCSVLRPIVSFYVQFQMCRREIIGCKDSWFWRFYQIFDRNVCPQTIGVQSRLVTPIVSSWQNDFRQTDDNRKGSQADNMKVTPKAVVSLRAGSARWWRNPMPDKGRRRNEIFTEISWNKGRKNSKKPCKYDKNTYYITFLWSKVVGNGELFVTLNPN